MFSRIVVLLINFVNDGELDNEIKMSHGYVGWDAGMVDSFW